MSRVLTLVDSLITAPAVPALTVDYAKRHIRSLGDSEDVLVATWIAAATQYVEEQTNRQCITGTREVWLDAFPGPWWPTYYHRYGTRIEIPHPPLQSIVSVEYIDINGVLQSVTDSSSPPEPLYLVKAPQGPYAIRGWIEPIYGNVWPIARRESGAVRIRYTCGYGDTDDDVPELLRGILCFLVGHFDQFRLAVHEARRGQMLELPYGVQVMMDAFKYSAYPRMVVRDGMGWWGDGWDGILGMALTINAGDLRQRMLPENPGSPVPDGEGGFTYVWTALDPSPWWSMIEAASARASERHFSGTVVAHSTHIASGRFHGGITTKTRLTWTDRSGRVHQANVLAVEDTDGAGIETVVAMSEIAP